MPLPLPLLFRIACVAVPSVLSALSAQAARLDALSLARWDYAGMYLAYPVDNPLGVVFPDVTGAFGAEITAGNVGTLNARDDRTDILSISNPSLDRIEAVPAFGYAFVFSFGDIVQPTDPGDYDVSMRAAIHMTPEGSTERLLESFTFEGRLACPELYCFFPDMEKSSESFPALVFLELGPLESMTITLRTSASVDVRPVGGAGPMTPVPLPMSAPLTLTGLGLLVAMRRWSSVRYTDVPRAHQRPTAT